MPDYKYQDIHPYSPWLKADINIWDELAGEARLVSCAKGSILFRQNQRLEHIYIVKSGRLRITVFHASGEEKAVFIAEDGTMVGEEACLLDHPQATSAVAIVDTTAYKIPAEFVYETLRHSWNLSHAFLQLLAYKNMTMVKHLEMLAFHDAPQRIALTLFNLVQRYGAETAQGWQISIRFTHQDLAGVVNASRVTVNNVLLQMSGQGILSKTEGRYVIHDVDRLMELAASDAFA